MIDTGYTDDGMPDEWDTAFEPYAKAIGYLMRDWNSMQESFADLFVTLMKAEIGAAARAACHAVQSDRMQRKMVLETARVRFGCHEDHLPEQATINAHNYKAILWAIKKADSLGPQRDAAAHSPVAMYAIEPFQFIANHFFGHPLATCGSAWNVDPLSGGIGVQN